MTQIPGDSEKRKKTPVAAGVLDYFPLAIAAVARVSQFGNDKHNPGQPLHWSRDKSSDHRDCIARHLIECGTTDEESGELHDAALAWRALANLQLAEERRLGLAASAKTPKTVYAVSPVSVHTAGSPSSLCAITAGKKYLVRGDTEFEFTIDDDRDNELFCAWSKSAWIDGADWSRVEE